MLEKFIAERHQYSEFSVYFYHLVLGVGYSHEGQHERSLAHFFGCLEEIQLLIDEKQQRDATYEVTWEETEAMLDEVKFNIVLASLRKAVLLLSLRRHHLSRRPPHPRHPRPQPRKRTSLPRCRSELLELRLRRLHWRGQSQAPEGRRTGVGHLGALRKKNPVR